jgi:hypothetical protein
MPALELLRGGHCLRKEPIVKPRRLRRATRPREHPHLPRGVLREVRQLG